MSAKILNFYKPFSDNRHLHLLFYFMENFLEKSPFMVIIKHVDSLDKFPAVFLHINL